MNPQQHTTGSTTQAYRASVLYFIDDPLKTEDCYCWHEDGLLVVTDGRIAAVGDHAKLAPTLAPGVAVEDCRGRIILPGFIDTHIHFPQTEMIASPASGLLEWLDTYTFVEEARFADPQHARDVAGFFLDELLRNGTTTAMVYCSVHAQSAEAFFIESEKRGTRMAAGKVLMDRHCPSCLQDTAEGGVRDTDELIRRWHGRGRQMVAITPRFAPTSTPQQLQLTGELAQSHPEVFVQTHVAENRDEIAWVKELFPSARSYLDVYDSYGLMRPRAVFAHCIWLDDKDRQRMVQTGTAASMCPTSNLFLGSGLFDFKCADAAGMLLSMGTDVGGGTSFSMLRTMDELHKVGRMGGTHLSALRLFYFATLGGARSLRLEGTVGSLAPGNEADFILLDPCATPLLERRSAHADSLEEKLFVLAVLGDDRAIEATYVGGRKRHDRGAGPIR